ncbi:MAG: DTW domain-containing protein [Alphaproteobacteria bacterium]|nr:DTW domain-containing protein [Alphaproteobacteria bacterium]
MPITADSCPTCGKPADVCVCARIEPMQGHVRVLVLQHPQEQDALLGSVPVLARGWVPTAVRVGLSWRSLAGALGEEVDPARWAVVWPNSLPRPLTEEEQAAPWVRLERGSSAPLEGVVLLDGTWSQGKALWWRNPWLNKLGRLVLNPKEPSIYGKLRKEPRKGWVSTLEAAAEALVAAGEPPEVRDALRRSFRTMVQRVRDRK